MAGYAFAMGACLRCGQPFTFNPVRVPSIRVNGQREPLCRACVDALNAERVKLGLERWVIPDDAYLLVEGDRPREHAPTVLIALILVMFGAVNLVGLFRELSRS